MTILTTIFDIGVGLAMAYVGYRFSRPLGWRLFRRLHRNNPEALAFADRHWPSK